MAPVVFTGAVNEISPLLKFPETASPPLTVRLTSPDSDFKYPVENPKDEFVRDWAATCSTLKASKNRIIYFIYFSTQTKDYNGNPTIKQKFCFVNSTSNEQIAASREPYKYAWLTSR